MIKLNLSRMPVADAIATVRREMDQAADASFKKLLAALTRDGVQRDEIIEIMEMELAEFNKRGEDYLADLKADLISSRRHSVYFDTESIH